MTAVNDLSNFKKNNSLYFRLKTAGGNFLWKLLHQKRKRRLKTNLPKMQEMQEVIDLHPSFEYWKYIPEQEFDYSKYEKKEK